MKPYYDRDGITIYHADALDVLPGITADVVVTDPPYGIGDKVRTQANNRRGGTNHWHSKSEWDKQIDPRWCESVCATAPIVAWMGYWRKREEVEKAMPHTLRAEIVWAKNCHVGPPCPVVAMKDERLWLFAKDGIRPRQFDVTVWDVAIIPTWAKKQHKNQKPVPLMERVIALLTDPGDLVVDPFMGSGTTLVAAMALGRRAVGVDISEDHCKAAVERLRQTVLPLVV